MNNGLPREASRQQSIFETEIAPKVFGTVLDSPNVYHSLGPIETNFCLLTTDGSQQAARACVQQEEEKDLGPEYAQNFEGADQTWTFSTDSRRDLAIKKGIFGNAQNVPSCQVYVQDNKGTIYLQKKEYNNALVEQMQNRIAIGRVYRRSNKRIKPEVRKILDIAAIDKVKNPEEYHRRWTPEGMEDTPTMLKLKKSTNMSRSSIMDYFHNEIKCARNILSQEGIELAN